ncbi:MAG: hypothetical protein JW867_08915 [Candidatus Omnitrophica bacterium]|nr:hypothetical protein [Candidatus Omnitrophota bacterium]
MKHSLKTGVSFGLTSAIITTLGLMVGLYSGTGSKALVIAGILTIAIADAFSDALGIHISEESENKHSHKEIWESTIYTFISKFVFSSSFILAFLFLPLQTAVVINILWGICLLIAFNLYLAKDNKTGAWKVVAEHLLIALVVIFLTHFVGIWINAAVY